MKVCGAKKVVSTLTNSVNVTSGPPCLAVIKRKDASVTPSIGERPMMGFSIFCQKFILPVRVPQPNTSPNRIGVASTPNVGTFGGILPQVPYPSGALFLVLLLLPMRQDAAMHSTRSVQGCAKPAFPGYRTFSL